MRHYQTWCPTKAAVALCRLFTAIKDQLIGSTTADAPKIDSMIDTAANAALAGALVIHVFAAKREERKFEAAMPNGQGRVGTVSSSSVWSSISHFEQLGLFRCGQLPTLLLDHFHSPCLGMSAVRFVLAITGIMCFVWLRLLLSRSMFVSACCAACVVSGAAAIFWPSGSTH